MQPSNFCKHPYDSVFQQSEYETIARNIMVILSRTGNAWRRLSWEEYKEHRIKDGNFTESEKSYFDRAIEYTDTEGHARQFSPAWRE